MDIIKDCSTKKIPKNVKKLLGPNQKVMFCGSFNINDINKIGTNTVVAETYVSKNKNGFNISTKNFQYINTLVPIVPNFSHTTNTLQSYDKTLKKNRGCIVYTSIYPTSNAAGITDPGIYKFLSLGGNGIYDGITDVISDTTGPIKKIYFCS